MRRRFTRTFCERAEPGWYWDETLPGFGLAVRESGNRSYYVKTRDAGRQVKICLGGPPVVDLEAARERARELLVAAKTRGSLAEVRPTGGHTIADLARQHQDVHRVRPSTRETYAVYWKIHIVPALGRRRVVELSRLDVQKLHADIGDKSPATANRVVKLLSKAINDMNEWGSGWPSIANPAMRIKKFREYQRETILSPEEARRLIIELQRRVAANPRNSVAWLVLILMMTGLRSSEWRLAKWEDLDFKNGTFDLKMTKAGAPRRVFLDEAVLKLLSAMPRRGRYVFPNEDGSAPIGKPQGQWRRIRKVAGLPTGFRVHDLRHSFASMAMVKGGLSISEVAELLGHSSTEITSRYLHLLDTQKREARRTASAALVEMIGVRC